MKLIYPHRDILFKHPQQGFLSEDAVYSVNHKETLSESKPYVAIPEHEYELLLHGFKLLKKVFKNDPQA